MHLLLLALVALLGVSHAAAAQSTTDRAALSSALDSLARLALQPGRLAGMTVAIVRGNDTILHRAYGYADIATNVTTPVGAIYEIGSLTKQFTSAAILQLVSDGKLRLDDELSQVLPGYNTQGHRVTIRHLLNHTSGIKSYTSLPGFGALQSRPGSRDSLVGEFSRSPFNFPPGSALSYNNSAYMLLGLIIERLSGERYEDYVARRLFASADMRSSSYCDRRVTSPRSLKGYSIGDGALVPTPFIDHTWPYAAGSLCSTATDLVRWTTAVHSGKILRPAAYAEWMKADTLTNGYRLRYAKGVVVDSLLGRRVVRHGGDIPGFSSEVQHYLDDSLTVVVLMNTLGSIRPVTVATTLAGRVLGGRRPTEREMGGTVADYSGTYRAEGGALTVTVRGDGSDRGLTVQLGNGNTLRPAWISDDALELGQNRYTFIRSGQVVTGMVYDGVFTVLVLKREP